MSAQISATVTYGYGQQKREGGPFTADSIKVETGPHGLVLTVSGERDKGVARKIYKLELGMSPETALAIAGLLPTAALGHMKSVSAALP